MYKKKSRNRDFLKNQSEPEITKGAVSRMSTVSNLPETPQSLRINILIITIVIIIIIIIITTTIIIR